MAEWLKALAWKAGKCQKCFGGSNPPLSAGQKEKEKEKEEEMHHSSVLFLFLFLFLILWHLRQLVSSLLYPPEHYASLKI